MAKKTTLTLLQLNDLHGYIEPHWEMVRKTGSWSFEKLGGLARIATLFRKTREHAPDSVLTLDNGDTFHGTQVAVFSRGQALVPLLNALKIDAMTVHWEFAYGPEGVRQLASKLNYPMLAINCYRNDDGSLFLKPYEMIERAGVRIAIIGLACPIVDKTMPASFSVGLRFSIGNEELPFWIRTAKEKDGAQLIVVLSHLGFPQDVQLAKETSDIDILVSGHTHNRMDHAIVVNGTVIFQSGCHGSFVGRLDIDLADGKIETFRHTLIPIDDSLEEDPEIRQLVSLALAPHKEEMNAIVGETTAPLHRYSMLSSPMDDVLLQAIAETAKTEIAFSNAWRYGAPIPAGQVTAQDLWNIIPMNPIIQTVELTGFEIYQMLEESLERTFAANPYEQMGGYVKRMRGLVLYFKAENPSGHRIDRLFVKDGPIVVKRTYKVAFVTSQGVPSKFGSARQKLDVDAVTSLRQFFKKNSPVTPSIIQTVYEI